MRKFWKDEEGLTTVEYALLLALLVVAALVVWTQFGGTVRNTVGASKNAIENAASGGG